jgi:hypothetical protein
MNESFMTEAEDPEAATIWKDVDSVRSDDEDLHVLNFSSDEDMEVSIQHESTDTLPSEQGTQFLGGNSPLPIPENITTAPFENTQTTTPKKSSISPFKSPRKLFHSPRPVAPYDFAKSTSYLPDFFRMKALMKFSHFIFLGIVVASLVGIDYYSDGMIYDNFSSFVLDKAPQNSIFSSSSEANRNAPLIIFSVDQPMEGDSVPPLHEATGQESFVDKLIEIKASLSEVVPDFGSKISSFPTAVDGETQVPTIVEQQQQPEDSFIAVDNLPQGRIDEETNSLSSSKGKPDDNVATTIAPMINKDQQTGLREQNNDEIKIEEETPENPFKTEAKVVNDEHPVLPFEDLVVKEAEEQERTWEDHFKIAFFALLVIVVVSSFLLPDMLKARELNEEGEILNEEHSMEQQTHNTEQQNHHQQVLRMQRSSLSKIDETEETNVPDTPFQASSIVTSSSSSSKSSEDQEDANSPLNRSSYYSNLVGHTVSHDEEDDEREIQSVLGSQTESSKSGKERKISKKLYQTNSNFPIQSQNLGNEQQPHYNLRSLQKKTKNNYSLRSDDDESVYSDITHHAVVRKTMNPGAMKVGRSAIKKNSYN